MNLLSKVKAIFTRYPVSKIVLPILLSLIFLVLVFRFVGIGANSESNDITEGESADIRDLDAKDRPYVGLVPRADGHALILTVTNHQNFSSLDFEILYQAGNLQQGSIGQIDLTKSAYKTEITLGACSKGVCRYDDDVKTGSLKLNGVKNKKQFIATIPFVLEKITPEASNIIGPVGTLDIEIPSGSVTNDYYVLLAETLGVPIPVGNLKGQTVAIFSIAPKLNRPAVIKLKDQNIAGLKVNHFDFSQNAWSTLETNVENGNQFNSDYLGLFAFTQ
ncbi:hypothetical protein KBB41_02115 [Candidatus Curtissbacteria bacterium]|nr:hypothetical protein [Candidatus Curtissbacteria bacterium]